jgi:hypothetical protein
MTLNSHEANVTKGRRNGLNNSPTFSCILGPKSGNIN